jgi:hypothetical protein
MSNKKYITALIKGGMDPNMAASIANQYNIEFLNDTPEEVFKLKNADISNVCINDIIDILGRLYKNHSYELEYIATSLSLEIIKTGDVVYLTERAHMRQKHARESLEYFSIMRRQNTTTEQWDNLDWCIFAILESFYYIEFTSPVKQRNMVRDIIRGFIQSNLSENRAMFHLGELLKEDEEILIKTGTNYSIYIIITIILICIWLIFF